MHAEARGTQKNQKEKKEEEENTLIGILMT